MKRIIAVLVTLSVLLSALTGCDIGEGASTVDQSLTLGEAKATAQSMELELAEFVPSDVVAAVEQRPLGSLLSCDRDRGYQWSGRTDVIYKDGASMDAQELVDAITASFASKDGFRAESAPTVDGQPGVHVLGTHGSGYLVNENAERSALQILSFSPCFVLPEGQSPSKQY